MMLSTSQDPVSNAIIACMAQGKKDAAIARELGLSLRTIHRRVADYMLAAGVSNRFQAGAHWHRETAVEHLG